MKDNLHEKKSSLCFPMTDAIKAYVAIQRAHDAVSRHVSKKLIKWKLSVPKYGIILHLYDNESLPLSELSSLIFRGNSNLTTLITRMEKEGWVERVDNDGDRRVKKIRLTEKGRELAPKIISEYRAFLHQMMMNCLLPNDQKVLIDLLSKLKESILAIGRD